MVITHSQMVNALQISSVIFKNMILAKAGEDWFAVDEKVRE
jgi:hypothetical protein